MLLWPLTAHKHLQPWLYGKLVGFALGQVLTPSKAAWLALLVPENVYIPNCNFRNVCRELLRAEAVRARAAEKVEATLV